jgi:protein-tyrosine phosphatase
LLSGVVELSLGCDFHLTRRTSSRLWPTPLRYSIDGKGYLLIEFPNMDHSSPVERCALPASVGWLYLIVTHPERYPAVQRQPEMLADWMRQGCLSR